jgi:plasmid stabilization system protein ParE
MVKGSLKIIWDIEARNNFRDSILHIQQDSPQNAEKVRKDIISTVGKLITKPQKYAPDKYRKNNDGSFRALELHHFRISYHVSDDMIRIVRFRHTSMKPLKY